MRTLQQLLDLAFEGDLSVAAGLARVHRLAAGEVFSFIGNHVLYVCDFEETSLELEFEVQDELSLHYLPSFTPMHCVGKLLTANNEIVLIDDASSVYIFDPDSSQLHLIAVALSILSEDDEYPSAFIYDRQDEPATENMTTEEMVDLFGFDLSSDHFEM